jgi:uncharacterized protein (TIGR02996 family)
MAASKKAAERSWDLLAAIVAAPDDDAPRMIYADWLSEQGDPRGEFIALQLAAAKLPWKDWAKRDELEDAAGKLQAKHRKTWKAELDEPVYRRGFVERVKVTAEALLDDTDGLFEAAPLLRGIELAEDVDDATLAKIGAGKQLLRFSELVLTTSASTRALVSFVGAPGVANLRSLSFVDTLEVQESVATAMSKSPHLKKLGELRFESTLVGSVGLRTLLNAKTLPALRTLRLWNSNVQDAGATAMAATSRKLDRLELGICDFTPKSVKAILNSNLIGGLTYLEFDHRFVKSGAQAIAASTKLKKLRALDLGYGHLGNDGAHIVAKAKSLPEVEWLRVGDYGLEEDGRAALEARYGAALQIYG